MIKKIFTTKWKGEGAGATVRRAIGVPELGDLDPFLMLDFFKVRLPAGFPDHPHRGFETVTYMISGKILHEDFKGNAGQIGPGDIQWMTAGKGIVHAEMPASHHEDSIGFQLWINLPKSKKLTNPQYQEFKKEEIPVYHSQEEGVTVVVIAGEYKGVQAVIQPQSTTEYYDVHLEPGKRLMLPIPAGWNGLVYPYQGNEFFINLQKVLENQAVQFIGNGDQLDIVNNGSSPAKFIVISGKPLQEPVAKYGPFVMSTNDELEEAFEDYQDGKNGFENSRTWKSQIRKLSTSSAESDL